MLEILDTNNNFCDTTFRPWIFLLVFTAVFVLGWVIYQNNALEPEDMEENIKESITNNSNILAGYQTLNRKESPSSHHLRSSGGINGDSRGWLGIEVQPVDKTVAYHLGLPYIGGALVNNVIEGSPAWNKGLERGDVIMEFDGRKVVSLDCLEELIEDMKPSETVKILVYRNREFHECYIALGGIQDIFGYR